MNRIFEHLSPSRFTRLVSVGRQLQALSAAPVRLVSGCAAAKTLGTTSAKVVGIVLDGPKGSFRFALETNKKGATVLAYCGPDDIEG